MQREFHIVSLEILCGRYPPDEFLRISIRGYGKWRWRQLGYKAIFRITGRQVVQRKCILGCLPGRTVPYVHILNIAFRFIVISNVPYQRACFEGVTSYSYLSTQAPGKTCRVGGRTYRCEGSWAVSCRKFPYGISFFIHQFVAYSYFTQVKATDMGGRL